MGVRGLMSVIKKKGVPSCGNRVLVDASTTLVIDGNAFGHFICNCKSYTSWACPLLEVDYSILRDKVIAFCTQTQQSGAKCIFVFDSVVAVEKLKTKLCRVREQVDNLRVLRANLDENVDEVISMHSLPLLAISCIWETLGELGIEAIFADGEADIDIARIAIERKAVGIVSCDTDMLVFHYKTQHGLYLNTPGLIILADDCFGHDPVRNELFVWVIDPIKVASMLGLPPQHLSRVAALAGYDYSDKTIIPIIHTFLAERGGQHVAKGNGSGSGSSILSRKVCKKRKQGKKKGKANEGGRVKRLELTKSVGEKGGVKQDIHVENESITEYHEKEEMEKEVEELAITISAAVHFANMSVDRSSRVSRHKDIPAVDMFMRAVRFVKECLASDSFELAKAGPMGLYEELYRCFGYYSLNYLDDKEHEGGSKTTEERGPYLSMLRQPKETGIWIEPVHFLFGNVTEEAEMKFRALLRNIRCNVYGLLRKTFVLEVVPTSHGDRLESTKVHVHRDMDAVKEKKDEGDGPIARLLSCLFPHRSEHERLTLLSSFDDGKSNVASKSGHMLTPDILQICMEELRTDLLIQLGNENTREATARHLLQSPFHATTASLLDSSDSADSRHRREEAAQLNIWTVYQTAFLYANLVAAAVVGKEDVRLRTHILRKLC